SPQSYKDAVEELSENAEARAEEVRLAKKAGEMDRNATWEARVELPPGAAEIIPIAGWPTAEVDGEDVDKVLWDSETRTLTVRDDVLSDRDRAQLLANGSEPEFRDALTSIYRRSSVLKISIGWLCLFYFLVTVGELCLSPVGLSLVTKAAPPKLVGLFMGFWFFTTGAVSNCLAHFVGGMWGTMTPMQYF
ncbi:MAG: peptide MFS transporter, partial [bacterium]|nr:peptide MFS transporter [bacterium]